MEEEAKKAAEAYGKYAEKAGISLNPDQKIVEMVVKGLLANQKKHGVRYCPCRIVTGDKEQDRKIICPCAYHRDEIMKDGRCHCGLFVKA